MTQAERTRGVTEDAGRLEAFSDAVMAVIITILAFLFIAIYWNNHHHLLRATTRISGAVMWANMLLLFCLSLAPVVTEWIRDRPSEALPVASFGVVSLAAAVSYTLLEQALLRANERDSLLARALAVRVKGYASVAMYASAVGLAAVSVWISYALYAAVAVMWLVPDRRFTRAEVG